MRRWRRSNRRAARRRPNCDWRPHSLLKRSSDLRCTADAQHDQRIVAVEARRAHPRDPHRRTRLAVRGNGRSLPCGVLGGRIDEHIHLAIVDANLIRGNREEAIHFRRNLSSHADVQPLLPHGLHEPVERRRRRRPCRAAVCSGNRQDETRKNQRHCHQYPSHISPPDRRSIEL